MEGDGEGGEGAAPEPPEQGLEQRLVAELRELSGAVVEASVQRPHRVLASIKPDRVVEVCRFLRERGFDHLSCITCVDYESELEMVYILWSYRERCLVELRARVSGTEPKIASVTSIWTGAEFHEREAYDMFGVHFDGCPNLRRVLLPEEWTVFPLRKSFRVESIYERERRLEAERAGRPAQGAHGAPRPERGDGGGAARGPESTPAGEVARQKEEVRG